jgi:RNA polymerase sigma-70 factor (ECF subfamily)
MSEAFQTAELNRFLSEVETSAFQIARYAVRDTDEALDLVQDAMFTLARKYGSKPVSEWRPLFFRILQNRIRDWHRRSSVRRRLFSESVADGMDRIDNFGDSGGGDPMLVASADGAADVLQHAVQSLPLRQQQAFLLRSIEGMSVAETAKAMGCSEGSVKTHYSRAMSVLRDRLEEHL